MNSIIGTALGALAGGGIFNGIGGGSKTGSTDADSEACAFVSKDTFWRQNVGLEKELGVQRYDNLKANYELYITLDNKISAIQSKNAALEASLPLAMQLAAVNAERYADNKIADSTRTQTEVNFILQREIDRKINGTMGLPYSDIITGIPKMPACTLDVTCPTAPKV